ncbi:hypothetical protein GOBAR_DD24431 [Gossypium barbadense]|nr:hypothetical protein GOBAR_DD24431 [Gossypium barbadense]
MDISLEKDKLSESQFFDDWETKKVWFKERDGDVHVEIVMDLVSLPKVSWKQMLLGIGVSVQEEGPQSNEFDIVEDLEFLEGDVKKSMVNGLSAIEFSDHNGYFLAKLQCIEDYNKVLTPLVSQVLVNGELIRAEYEALPTICSLCEKYGHLKETCPSLTTEMSLKTGITSDNLKPSNSTIGGKRSAFGPWMVVERKIRRGWRNQRNQRGGVRKNFFARLMGKDTLALKKGDAGLLMHPIKGVGSGSQGNDSRCEGGQNNKAELDLGLRPMRQVVKDLGKRQTKTGGPRDNEIGLNITGSNTMRILNGKIDGLHENCNKPKMIVVDLNAIKQLGNLFNDPPQSSKLSNGPFVTTTYFNHTFEESEGMAMALDGNVLDLRKDVSVQNFSASSVNTIERWRLLVFLEVFGSLDRKKRKKFWESLTSIIPYDNTLWMAIGDFDALVLLVIRKEGIQLGKGELYERLDKVIGNDTFL